MHSNSYKDETTICPVCGSRDSKEVYERRGQPCGIYCERNGFVKLDMSISICSECSFLFFTSRDMDGEYDTIFTKIYAESYGVTKQAYDACGNVNNSTLDSFPVPEHVLNYAITFLESNLDFKVIENALEVGSNRGDFLFHLKRRHSHLNIVGVEPQRLEFTGVPTIRAFFTPALFSNKFDLVILRHVIEHMRDPGEILNNLKKILSPEGLIFIEVPNTRYDISEKVEVFTPDHTGYFVSSSLLRLVDEAGIYPHALVDGKGLPLMLVAGMRKGPNIFFSEPPCLENAIETYMSAIDQTCRLVGNYVKDGHGAVFYGSKNAFLWFYSALENILGSEMLRNATRAVIDDDRNRVGKDIYGFRVEQFECLEKFGSERLVIIICASRKNAESMVSRIRESRLRNYKVILPWTGELHE